MEIARAVLHDQRVFLPLVVFLLAGVLALAFRGPSGLLLPLGAVGSSLARTPAAYVACGKNLNAVTSLLTPVVMIVALSVSVHLLTGHRRGLAEGLSPLDAAARAMWHLAVPCLLATLTTEARRATAS